VTSVLLLEQASPVRLFTSCTDASPQQLYMAVQGHAFKGELRTDHVSILSQLTSLAVQGWHTNQARPQACVLVAQHSM
jgi:hypothetical protein